MGGAVVSSDAVPDTKIQVGDVFVSSSDSSAASDSAEQPSAEDDVDAAGATAATTTGGGPADQTTGTAAPSEQQPAPLSEQKQDQQTEATSGSSSGGDSTAASPAGKTGGGALAATTTKRTSKLLPNFGLDLLLLRETLKPVLPALDWHTRNGVFAIDAEEFKMMGLGTSMEGAQAEAIALTDKIHQTLEEKDLVARYGTVTLQQVRWAFMLYKAHAFPIEKSFAGGIKYREKLLQGGTTGGGGGASKPPSAEAAAVATSSKPSTGGAKTGGERETPAKKKKGKSKKSKKSEAEKFHPLERSPRVILPGLCFVRPNLQGNLIVRESEEGFYDLDLRHTVQGGSEFFFTDAELTDASALLYHGVWFTRKHRMHLRVELPPSVTGTYYNSGGINYTGPHGEPKRYRECTTEYIRFRP